MLGTATSASSMKMEPPSSRKHSYTTLQMVQGRIFSCGSDSKLIGWISEYSIENRNSRVHFRPNAVRGSTFLSSSQRKNFHLSVRGSRRRSVHHSRMDCHDVCLICCLFFKIDGHKLSTANSLIIKIKKLNINSVVSPQYLNTA